MLFGHVRTGRIDLSCKSDLFDVLDADLSGELEFEEPCSFTVFFSSSSLVQP